jgi:hypothetical protein
MQVKAKSLKAKGNTEYRCTLHAARKYKYRLKPKSLLKCETLNASGPGRAIYVKRFALCILRSAFRVLRSAFRVSRSAFCVLRFALSIPRFAFCVKRSAFCVLRSALLVQDREREFNDLLQ